MTGEQKTGVWISAMVAVIVTVLITSITWYYHEKDERQAARGKANVDIVCNVVTPPEERP